MGTAVILHRGVQKLEFSRNVHFASARKRRTVGESERL